ncbi:ABC transporter permease [Streptomyces sp. NPDC051018]|uniref:ABC transporter permease n=1 Tax=Streptomyces sp. NPDC051018 TaxID=3365639 RepID=UPI0037A19A4A
MGAAVPALALADFRERRRRPAYLVVLLGTLALGLLAAPVGPSGWQIFQIGDYRGLYTSGYVGTVTALGGAVWLSLAGFSITRGTVTKDDRSGVGQILAATPMTRVSYLLGKFCSNLLVLGSMLLALAGTALGVQLVKGESYSVDPVRLLLPFVLITLPLLALVAACAVLFDTLPGLRGGGGALLWFVIWLVGMMASQASGGYDLLSMGPIGESMRTAIQAAGHPAGSVTFGVGLTSHDGPLTTFGWDGLGPGSVSGGPLAGAALLTVGAVVVTLLAGLWFRRFDPAVSAGAVGALVPGRTRASGPMPGPAAGPDESVTAPGASFAFAPASMTPARRGSAFAATLAGELRVLLRGMRWWWLGPAALAVASVLVEAQDVSHPVLALSMLWPVLIWSRMGHHADAGSLEDLLTASPSAGRRLPAVLLAGVAVSLSVSVLPMVRLLAAGDHRAVAAALAGALAVPALALLCGTVSRGPRLFQALYPLLWYGMFNRIAELDFLGVVPGGGPGPAAVAASALVLALVALGTDGVRRARR